MVGIDEVGRGCLAGPLLVVAARQTGRLPAGLKDSKLMTRTQREAIFESLVAKAEFGEGWVSCREIDNLGLTAATKLGVKRALRVINVSPEEELMIDGNINYAPKGFTKVTVVIDGDNKIPVISAASVYAKVKRDEYMRKLASRYPGYGLETHVGYGTPFHLLALQTFGAVENLHRFSFNPIRQTKLL